jgi:hypothetical protein
MNGDLDLRETLAERSSGVWDYISPSRLNLWLKCPLAFKLRYIDGESSTGTTSQFVGKMVHRGLERFYRHRQLGLEVPADWLVAFIHAEWEQAVSDEGMAFQASADEAAAQQQTADLLSAYLAQVSADEPRPLAVEAALEAPLIDPISGEDFGIPLVGIIDLILPETDGPVIADFKTTARGGEPLEVMHEVQLTSYSYLVRHSSAASESALEIRNLVKTKVPRVETHRYVARNDSHWGRFFALVRAYLDDLDQQRFTYRPGLGCGMCDFRHTHCRNWSG